MSDSVVVRVPASTSNCGPGFDTLGLALGLYGKVSLAKRNDDNIRYAGDNADFPNAALEMVVAVAAQFSKSTGLNPGGFDFEITSNVPIARGLGSSVILRGGILAGLNHMNGSPLSVDDQVALISKIEGHPDNASAAIMGGFTVARFCPETKKYYGTQKFPVSNELVFVVVSPNLEIKTDDSRATLPSQIEFPKVISSLNSLSYLVAAFVSKNYDALSACRIDHIHEPYRLRKIPHASEAIAKGIDAGAFTGWLSGSGSSILCVADKSKAALVRQAMESPWNGDSAAFTSYVLNADNEGATILG
jgi:homoserine kinase